MTQIVLFCTRALWLRLGCDLLMHDKAVAAASYPLSTRGALCKEGRSQHAFLGLKCMTSWTAKYAKIYV